MKRLTEDEAIDRITKILAQVDELLANEPNDSSKHGGWFNHTRSLIGKADHYLRYIRQREIVGLNDAIQKRWDDLQSKRRG